MAKAGPRSAVRDREHHQGAEKAPTRGRIVEAAVETLKQEGFAGASARAIAERGGFNQALVFYHFGSVNDLLLAALDATSERRMARYEQAGAQAQDLPELLRVARRIFQEDLDSGHLAVLAAMIAGASSVPDLGPAVVARIEPWVRFTAEQIERMLAGSPLAGMVAAGDLAFAIVAMYLGMELLTSLDGDRARVESLFAMSDRLLTPLAPLLASLSSA